MKNTGKESLQWGELLHIFIYVNLTVWPFIEVICLRLGILSDMEMAGLAAGLYSGITYSMKETRGGAHDWASLITIVTYKKRLIFLPSLY